MKIAVVGAGPAGLICAWQLSLEGHQVIIYDKKANLDAQGSGVVIQPVGLQVLNQLGILDELLPLGQRINFITGYAGCDKSRQVINANYSLLNGPYNYALGINRSALWSVLYQKIIAQGIPIVSSANIVELRYLEAVSERRSPSAELLDQHKKSYGPFNFVIDASGANSKLRRYAAVQNDGEVLQYGSLWASCELPAESSFDVDKMQVYTGSDNQGVGVMPTGRLQADGVKTVTLFFNINWQRFPEWTADAFEQWRADIIQRWPMLENLMQQLAHKDQFYLAKFRHHTMSCPYGNGIVFIGDAAHCSSPQLGQGINMSLIDALVLSKQFKKHQDYQLAFKRYARSRKAHVTIYQSLARLIAPFYQSDARLAIMFRDHVFSLFTKLFLFTLLTTTLLSGRVAWPLKNSS